MSLRTKKARRVLTKAQQKHLTEVGINSMTHFTECRKWQHENKRECPECRSIEIRLEADDE